MGEIVSCWKGLERGYISKRKECGRRDDEKARGGDGAGSVV